MKTGLVVEGRDIGFFDMRYDLTNGQIEEGMG